MLIFEPKILSVEYVIEKLGKNFVIIWLFSVKFYWAHRTSMFAFRYAVSNYILQSEVDIWNYSLPK